MFAKFDSNRMLYWATFFGGALRDETFSLDHDSQGNLYCIGNTLSDSSSFPLKLNGNAYYDDTNVNSSPIDMDFFLGKFSPVGEQLWTTFYGGDGHEHWGDVIVDKNNVVFFAGSTASPDFETLELIGTHYQSELDNIANGDQYDGFLLAFDPSLTRIWSTFFGGHTPNAPVWDREGAYTITSLKNDDILIAGNSTSVDPTIPLMNPGRQTYFQDNPTEQDVFISKFCVGGLITEIQDISSINNSEIRISPNPANTSISISIANDINEQVVIYVYDAQGRNYLKNDVLISDGIYNDLNISHLPNGIYFIKLEHNQISYQGKFIRL